MARYIDADVLIKKMFPLGIGDGMYVINAKAAKFAIDQMPAADVVPKSEIDAWAELYAASQKKWETAYEECESKVRAETAREIFAEIEKMATTPFRRPNEIVIHEQKIVGLDRIIALKKIFTEDLK